MFGRNIGCEEERKKEFVKKSFCSLVVYLCRPPLVTIVCRLIVCFGNLEESGISGRLLELQANLVTVFFGLGEVFLRPLEL